MSGITLRFDPDDPDLPDYEGRFEGETLVVTTDILDSGGLREILVFVAE